MNASIIRICLSTERGLFQKLNTSQLVRVQGSTSAISLRTLSLSHYDRAVAKGGFVVYDEGIFQKALKKIKYYTYEKTKLKVNGFYLYESIADKIPYLEFFRAGSGSWVVVAALQLSVMSMPDTFNSWFLVTELHVWMLMVKCMDMERDGGRAMRNYIVEAMWADISMKIKKLGPEHQSAARDQVHTLGDQFQAALLSYDEGLLSDDKVLASALWRRFFETNCSDVRKLEMMVEYVRKQVHYLESLTEEDFKAHKVYWLPFEKT